MLKNLQELYQYRALLWSLVGRELKARYRASVLGFLWTFLNPALNMVIFSVVVRGILKHGGADYPYFLFCGQLVWINFSSAVLGGTSSLSDRGDLLTKVRFPAQVLPATVVSSNLVNYLLSLPLMLLLGWYYGDTPSVHMLLLPVLLLIQTVFTLALTYFLSAYNLQFRDLQHLVANLMTALMFLSPVLWSVDQVEEPLRTRLLTFSPIHALLAAYRDILYYHRWPDLQVLAAAAGISWLAFALASRLFQARSEEFAEQI